MKTPLVRKSGCKQRGFGLVEPLISICILSFGLLGLAHFQLNMLAQSADAKSRMNATALSEELLAQVRVDPVNAGCFTTVAGACGYPAALQTYKDWEAKATGTLESLAGVDKSQVSVASELNTATGLLTLTLTWATKGSPDKRTYKVVTDVRT